MNSSDTIGHRAAMKSAIISLTTEIREHRGAWRTHLGAARVARRAGENDQAEICYTASRKAEWAADALGPEARYLQLTYAFARGRLYLALEATRRRAPAPDAETIAETLHRFAAPGCQADVETWLAVRAAGAAPALPVLEPALAKAG